MLANACMSTANACTSCMQPQAILGRTKPILLAKRPVQQDWIGSTRGMRPRIDMADTVKPKMIIYIAPPGLTAGRCFALQGAFCSPDCAPEFRSLPPAPRGFTAARLLIPLLSFKPAPRSLWIPPAARWNGPRSKLPNCTHLAYGGTTCLLDHGRPSRCWRLLVRRLWPHRRKPRVSPPRHSCGNGMPTMMAR